MRLAMRAFLRECARCIAPLAAANKRTERAGSAPVRRFVDQPWNGRRFRGVQEPFDSGPAAPVAIAISDPPIAPIAVSFASGPSEKTPGALEKSAPLPTVRRGPALSSRALRAAGWGLDLILLAPLLAAHVVVAARLGGPPQPFLSVLLAAPWLWLALAMGLALAWSWVFVALWGRTPGMACTGQRLRTSRAGQPGPMLAFARAALAVLFCAPGLFGFALAFFDPRNQTLHDKLCGCVAVVD
jgi:RDD family